MSAPTVFISYSHDSPEHEDRVLELSDRLREEGIAANIDQYQTAPPEGWQLWMEKEIKSVANVTRQDVREFLGLAAEASIKPEYQEYEFKDANRALIEMKQGKIRGAKVLKVSE